VKNINIQTATVFGLLTAFFLVPLFLYLFPLVWPADPLTNTYVMARETGVFLIAGILILIIIKGEGKGLASIGLHNKSWLKSFGLSFLILMISLGIILLCLSLFGYLGISFGEGAESKSYDNISLWVMTFLVLRAGIVEELCYRGYIIERLENLSHSWIIPVLLPAVIFALLHYKQGIGGIIISFLTGLVMAVSYWKKRDLKANMIAHFSIDFIANVLIPLLNN